MTGSCEDIRTVELSNMSDVELTAHLNDLNSKYSADGQRVAYLKEQTYHIRLANFIMVSIYYVLLYVLLVGTWRTAIWRAFSIYRTMALVFIILYPWLIIHFQESFYYLLMSILGIFNTDVYKSEKW